MSDYTSGEALNEPIEVEKEGTDWQSCEDDEAHCGEIAGELV